MTIFNHSGCATSQASSQTYSATHKSSLQTAIFKKTTLASLVVASLIAVAAPASAAPIPDYQLNDPWFINAKSSVDNKANTRKNLGPAKNVILFVGDGMGISTLTAARILDGQQKGMLGEENYLSFERFPNTALIKTYNSNQQTPDSAGTMTAMSTGVKTRAGVINIAPDALRANCTTSKGRELTTLLEYAEAKGLSTGVVTTARLTHATPAATYAKSPERDWESDDKLPDEAKQNGCQDIATQFVQFNVGDGIDVAFGGGRRHFIPKELTDVEGKSGKRSDGQDLTKLWQQKTGGVYVEDARGFSAIPANADKVLGLFNSSHMQYESDRKNDKAGEPSLTEMTTKAVQLLENRSQRTGKGYVLVVESGRIDHAHHAGNAYNALQDTIEYSKAVDAAHKLAGDDTLIMVTADHSHVFTIAGYPKRGNPILGKVVGTDDHGLPESTPVLAMDNLPYTTLGYTNGLGYRNLGNETDADAAYDAKPDTGRHDLSAIDTTQPGFHQEALIPLDSETHAGEDISLHATGPGSAYVQGVMEQNSVFHVINQALDLGARSQ